MRLKSRRQFLNAAGRACVAGGAALVGSTVTAQDAGERPQAPAGVTVVNPRGRVPVGLIIDDSTCLVNLNRFAMPQFNLAFGGRNAAYHKPWRDWPIEIPDDFVRRFGEWAASAGVKGKYSVVPYPACVGRLDRFLPGWTQEELDSSLNLVRTLMTPNWDIHPEMVTHTRVIDLKTGQPYPNPSLGFMENWDWTTGRSVDEITAYLTYALQILKNVGLHCDGVTTPGGFGSRARPQLAAASLQAVREVFGSEVPHYFRDAYDSGAESVAPRVELAAGLGGPDPRCVVSIVGCTGDWTGGWDCTTPQGANRFITEDLQQGRMVEVIARGGPAMMLCHWTGIYWSGRELGLGILQEVVRRLHARFDNLVWMKLSEVARYWAARELTRIERTAGELVFEAPFACPEFTVRFKSSAGPAPLLLHGRGDRPLREVAGPLKLEPGSWCLAGEERLACFQLPRGISRLRIS